jgi:signal transduction histidine kinase
MKIEPLSQMIQSLSSVGVRAVVSAPLMVAGKALGALSVGNDEPGSYNTTHVEIVEEVASSVALAVHSARLREDLDNNSHELQLLSARLISAQETEKKRLSHELHDEMGQLLTAISLNLAAVERNIPETGSESLRERLDDANEFVVDLTNRVRSLSIDLRPSMLHDLGLLATLHWFVANYVRRTKTEIDFESDIPERLPEDVEITAYRVIQEALTNVSRHSDATVISLLVNCINGQLTIVVEDDGRGFDVRSGSNGKPDVAGIGLVMMRERVAAVGGRLNVYSTPGNGTRLSAVIPVKEFE